MAPPCDQRNDGSLRAYLHRPAPRGTPVVAATASDQTTDRDNRADAKLQLLALRRQNKKDKEKARKERRKQQVTPATTATAAAAAAAAVPGAAVAVAVESQGKQTATGAAGAGAIGQVAVAVAVVATAVVVESVESAEQPAASGGSGAPEGSTQSCKSAEAAGPSQSREAPESKEAPKSQQSEEEPEEVAQVRQTGESTEPVKLGKSGESSSSSTEESGKSAHQSRQSGAELGQSGKSPAGMKEGAMTESSRQLAMDVDVAAVEVGVAAAGKAELSAPPPPSSPAAAAASSPLLSPSSVTSTTVDGDNTCEPVLARQRLQEPLLPMLNKKKNDDDDNSQVTEIKKVATTHVAAEAAEAAQGVTVPATASTTAAAAVTTAAAVSAAAAAAAAAVQAAKEAGEKANQHALLEKREVNMSTGIVRDQAQEKQDATSKSKNRPVLRLPPARKHAAGPLKACTSPTEAPELLLPAARDLWAGRCQSSRGGLKKGDLHPLVLEAIRGHPDLFELSPDELSVYVDTVLAIVFYWYSRCGIVRLCDLRSGGFIQELDAVGRLEMGLEESEYFSLARHEVMRTEFFRLCDGGWSVGHEALRWYRHYGDGSVVGAVRARRVIDAGLRPFPREKPTGSGMSGVGGYGDELEYDGWVCFFLCEEALRYGTWSERDVRYCFHLVDETGRGRVGMTEVTRFFEDMQWDSVISGYSEDAYWPSVQEVISHHLDSMAVEKRRDYITLKEMTRSDYTVDRAGNFFEELFAGTAPPENGYSNGEDEYEDNDYEGTGGGEDGNSETTGEGQSFHSTGGGEGGEAEGTRKSETFGSSGEELGGIDSEGTRQEGQQCQPPPPPPPPLVAGGAPAGAGAVPCALPVQTVQTVQTPVPYLQNVGGAFYPAQGPPLEQHGHQSWVPQQGNIAGGYPTSPSPGPPPPPPPPPLCAQAQAVTYGNHVEAAFPIPSSPEMQLPPPPPPQTGVAFSGNNGGTCYPVQAPPVEQHASSAYYAGNVAGNTRCSPTPLYMQPHTSAYGGTAVAGVSCPTQAGYMQPQGLAYGGHATGVFPMQQTGYMQPQQPGAYGERFEGMRPVGMGYMQPHPSACGGNLGGMCPMPPVSMPQYPPPVAYGGNPYPMQMPQW